MPLFHRLSATMCLCLTTALFAAPEAPFPLWPEGIPGGRRPLGAEVVDANGKVTHIEDPTLQYFPPAIDRPNGTAIVICPGGGYVGISRLREGVQYANWLSTLGVASFVLTSRIGEYGHPAPLQDVLRAIRVVRSRATEFRIDPARIGVMGSSAGGHLAACAGTLFEHPLGRTEHPLDAVSARPDFMVLLYPVITFEDPFAHAGSRRALIGPEPAPELVQLLSLENQVGPATPPAFIVHTQADKSVPVENSLRFFRALTAAGVSAELHVFPEGGHGIGMRDGLGTASDWPRRAEEWLRSRGLLAPPPSR